MDIFTGTMVRIKGLATKPNKQGIQCFRSNKLTFTKAEHKLRYNKFKHTPIVHPYSLDMEAIKENGLKEEFDFLLSENLWRHLLVDFNEPTYLDLVHELLTTLQFPKLVTDLEAKCIAFTSGGISFHLSPKDIDTLMGFEEMRCLSVEQAA